MRRDVINSKYSYELVEDEYEVIGEYLTAIKKVEILHKTCSESYLVAPNKFLGGRRCPKCRESKGEMFISEWLTDKQIGFITQDKFEGCKYKNKLPFDFGVYSGNSLKCLVEYDGELHYEAIDFFGGQKTLHITKRRDAIKTQYCTDNNIPLIRIPYWEYENIGAILTEKLLPLLYNADKHNAS